MTNFFLGLLILVASVLFLVSAFTKNILIAISALTLSLILEIIRRKNEQEKDICQPKEFLEGVKRSGKNKDE